MAWDVAQWHAVIKPAGADAQWQVEEMGNARDEEEEGMALTLTK